MTSHTPELVLIRHGETDYNRTNRYMGRLNEGLSVLGRAQAEQAAKRLAADDPHDLLYTSPLARTQETASYLESALQMKAIYEPGFLEIDMGPWEGRDRAEVAAEDPERWKIWLSDPTQVKVPGMESVDDVRDRVGEALERMTGGNVVELLSCAVGDNEVSEAELADLEKLIQQWKEKNHERHTR